MVFKIIQTYFEKNKEKSITLNNLKNIQKTMDQIPIILLALEVEVDLRSMRKELKQDLRNGKITLKHYNDQLNHVRNEYKTSIALIDKTLQQIEAFFVKYPKEFNASQKADYEKIVREAKRMKTHFMDSIDDMLKSTPSPPKQPPPPPKPTTKKAASSKPECKNLKKAVCQQNPTCKWVVGKGCK